MRRVGRGLATGALCAAALVAALVVGEGAVRVLDGEPLLTTRLTRPRPTASAPSTASTAALVRASAEALPLPDDVSLEWIDAAPPPLANRRAPDAELLRLRARPRPPTAYEFEAYRIWNAARAQALACAAWNDFGWLPRPLWVFDPPNGNWHPPYRYPPDRTTPLGLVTNHFGWRGPDIPLDKPAGTIRLAFVGASTTVGLHEMPFSYPEYVVHWFNLWAARAAPGVRFDGINAAREGIRSTDIAAIVRDEVLPAEPDLVVYYEGANQFLLRPLVDRAGDAQRPPAPAGRPDASTSAWREQLAAVVAASALVRRIDVALEAFAGDAEPSKPAYTLRWPAGVDEHAPDLASNDLPLHLPTILKDLDDVRRGLADAGSDFAVSSFVWLARDGLKIDRARHPGIYRQLNQDQWPYRYRDIRRLADFQNRVFSRWAAASGALFVDVAAAYPEAPDLFLDAIHMKSDGTRLHAWIVFLALLPDVRERIASGAWPRPDRVPLAAHPTIDEGHRRDLPCHRPARRRPGGAPR